ncbi:MAG: glycosyltransferase, partial [Bdellovibrionales bacterium]|nr:glycosyltransferase [Bdellovibrionales bacterium]
MKDISYLIVHKDHSFDIRGVNAGAEMATRFLARYLVEQGKRVIVAAQITDGLEGTIDGVEYWDLGSRYDVRGILHRASQEGPYHLISSGRSQAIFESEGDPQCKSRMLISHDRSANDTGINPVVLCEHLDHVICVSEAQRQVYLEAGAPVDKVTTIKNGVDHSIFQEGPPEGRNLRRLVFVGALVQDKGLHLLIHAYCALKQKYPDLSLDVYGSADLWGRNEYINPEDLQKRIPDLTFHGKQPQTVISQAFQTAGICVVPSIWFDPFPLTSIEAQTTGCPVVTFDVGGLKEGVIQGETGVVLSDITEDALTRTLDQLLSNPQQLQEMSRNALAKQRPYYNWERVATSVIDLAERFASDRSEKTQRIGFFTTWNQPCGLATYAKYLVSELPQGTYTILAEDSSDARREHDEPFVHRCWTKEADSWHALEQVLQDAKIEVLHLNMHNTEEFAKQSFFEALARFRARGGKVILQLHSIFTYRESAKLLFDAVDEVLVHSPEVRLEVIAHGVSGEKVSVIPHGVEVKASLTDEERSELRSRLGIQPDEKAIVCFGFVQAHKGIEGMIEGVGALRAQGIKAKGYVVGRPNETDPTATEYQSQLKELTRRMGLENEFIFLDRFVLQEEVTQYLQAADAVVMNYRSQHYEASGACSLAVGAGALVLTSLAPPFQAFGDAVWHLTSGFDIPRSLLHLLSTPELRDAMHTNIARYCRDNCWPVIANKLLQIYQKHHAHISYTPEVRVEESTKVKTMKSTNGMRVLIQNRGNMLTQRGGDTVVIEKLQEGLKAKGIESVLDLEMKEDPRNYDLVHLINFAMPKFIEEAGRRAKAAGTPFVVTTLCEDISSFHNQSLQAASVLVGYVEGGQDRSWYMQHWTDPNLTSRCEPFQNQWVAQNAACLIANGENEKNVVQSLYAPCAPVEVIPVGYDFGQAVTPDLFISEYGIKDFVFCVGRFESRKNQLMLLKAMEDLDMPLVLASGGFSYQPQYDQAVRSFKRRAQTIILERISAEMLASAYAAAKVHVLPSWYELPGLVSMEAAYHGCNVVAADNGTARNYLGDFAFYCQPGDQSSVQNALLAAYYSPSRVGFKEHVAQYTWQNATEHTIELYERVSGKASSQPQTSYSFTTTTKEEEASESFLSLLEAGENAARERDFEKAIRKLEQADTLCPNNPRVYRSRGAVAMAAENQELAEELFQKAYTLDPEDPRILSGLGMSYIMRKAHDEAYDLFVR